MCRPNTSTSASASLKFAVREWRGIGATQVCLDGGEDRAHIGLAGHAGSLGVRRFGQAGVRLLHQLFGAGLLKMMRYGSRG